MKIRAFKRQDMDAVIQLWKVCGLVVPQNDPEKDILRKLSVNPEWFLIGEKDGVVMASCMVGYEGHRGWINYLAVHPDFQRSGYASDLMAESEHLLKAAGCPKINLQIRATNSDVISFYENLGYTTDPVVSLAKRLESDSRTE